MKFGDKLKQLREQSGMTQAQLGEKIGVSDRIIGYYELNERFPRKQDVLVNLGKVFNVTVDFLLQETTYQEVTTECAFMEASTVYLSEPAMPTQEILSKLKIQFEGPQLTDAQKDKLFHDITDLYVAAKVRNSQFIIE